MASNTQEPGQEHSHSVPFPIADNEKVTATCHCGRVSVEMPGRPKMVKECRCSLCYRYGTLWTYFQDQNDVTITTKAPGLKPYVRADGNGFAAFYFCAHCGCLTHWLPTEKGDEERRKNPAGRSAVGVNCRMLPPKLIEEAERIIARDGEFRGVVGR